MLWKIILVALARLLDVADHGHIQPMPCESVLQLRVGHTRAEVRTLIGAPHFEVEQLVGWASEDVRTFHPRADYTFFYGTQQSGQVVTVGMRDEMTVDFLDDKLVSASACRMYVLPTGKEHGCRALWIGSRERNGPATYDVGGSFGELFNCTPTPALEEARKQFLAAGSAAPEPASPR